ncbi:uncharacterized protein Tco025E_05488 [Trypanosoma conorhini]|uniref:Uncharacterized protein n=1 Tax=Trypanosoma conorhini TaxID=83891 RepID=A0A3R7KUN5_9TRYP|nr:uncharacterized protein Tco025E_05488 [Trypanosoma conorhini]RNF15568.1 hypothetical protein Tco025E_05488 [Trypanosoma conorhini]
MSGATAPSIVPDSNLQKRGCEHRLATSSAGSGGDSHSSDTGPLLNAHPRCKALLLGVRRTEHSDTQQGYRAGEEERRGPDATGIEAAGASGGRPFRVRLTQLSSPRMGAQSLNRSRSASSPPAEAAAPWLEAAERRARSNTHWEPSAAQPPGDCLQGSHQERELHGAMDVTEYKTTGHIGSSATTTTTTRRNHLLESFLILENKSTQRAQEQRLAHERETQLRREYEAKIAELEGVVHASQRAASAAEAALVQKEVEQQTARASIAQRLNAEASANARCMLERTLKTREKELADTQELLRAEQARLVGALQREEVLRSQFLVAEETRVLYQLYLHRLLDLLRTRVRERSDAPLFTEPLVTNRDIVKAMVEALRSTDAATNDETNAMLEFTPEGGRGKADVVLQSPPNFARQLTNATLLKMSMLESTVAECMTLWRREEKRRHEHSKQTIEAVVNSCREELEAKLALVSSSVGKTERRIGEFEKMASTVFGEIAKNGHGNHNRVDTLQREVKRVNREYAQSQRLLQRTQAELSSLKDEVRRMDGDREAALLMHRAAELLEEVRQSVRGAVRSAAKDIEHCTLECNTLKEPFLQSMRVIALKVEAHAEIARTAARRHKSECVGDTIETVMRRSYSVGEEEVHRFLLSAPHRGSRSRDWHATQLMREDADGESKNLLILEGLSRVMGNFCQLLENNARQMDKNAVKLAQALAGWEDSIVGKMNEIWGFMRGMLVAGGMPSRPTPALAAHDEGQGQEWCNEARLALGDTNTNGSGRALIHQTQSVFSSAAGGVKSSFAGSISTSGSCAPSAVFAPSTINSAEASRAASTTLTPSSRRAPLAPLHEVEQTPDLRTRRGIGQTSPPSIAVSRTPTPTPPPPPSSSQVTNTVPPSQRPTQQQKSQLRQQRKLFAESPHNSPLSSNVSGHTLRIHYTRELGEVENNESRLVSGAVLSRRAAAPL